MDIFKCYLFSFPRSSNHWIRYILEFFSGRPTIGDGQTHVRTDWTGIIDSPICVRIPDLTVNLNLEPIGIKRHTILPEDDRNIPCIIILRNYKEVFMRNLFEQIDLDSIDLLAPVVKYMDLVNNFESWSSQKLVVYYEDLMEHPEENIKKILEFAMLPTEKVSDFICDYDKHTQLVLSMYSKTVSKTQTHGNTKLYYSSSLSESKKILLDEKFRRMGEVAFDKYLKRYSENLK